MSYSSSVTIEEEHLEISDAFRLWIVEEYKGEKTSYLYAKKPKNGVFTEMNSFKGCH